jgi:hypothetical protein
MVIFHSYVTLPQGRFHLFRGDNNQQIFMIGNCPWTSRALECLITPCWSWGYHLSIRLWLSLERAPLLDKLWFMNLGWLATDLLRYWELKTDHHWVSPNMATVTLMLPDSVTCISFNLFLGRHFICSYSWIIFLCLAG